MMVLCFASHFLKERLSAMANGCVCHDGARDVMVS